MKEEGEIITIEIPSNNPEILIDEETDAAQQKRKLEIQKYCGHFNSYLQWNKIIVNSKLNIRYAYVKSIYNLVTTGSYEKAEFLETLNALCKTKSPSTYQEENKMISNLVFFNNLSEEEFDSNVSSVLSNLKDGVYNIFEYTQIVRYLFHLSDLKLIDLEKQDVEKITLKTLESINIDSFDLSNIRDTIGVEYFVVEIRKYNDDLANKIKERINKWDDEAKVAKLVNETADDQSLLDSNILRRALSELDSKNISDRIIRKLHDREYITTLERTFRLMFPGDFQREDLRQINSCLKYICRQFEEYLDKKVTDKIDKYFISQLINTIKDCIKKTNSFAV